MHHANILFWIMGNTKNGQVRKSIQKDIIMCKIMKMLSTKILICIILQTSFLKLQFYGTHKESHGVRVLSKNYHMRLILN